MVHSPLDFRFAVHVACASRFRLPRRHFMRNWRKSHRLHPRRSSYPVCQPDDLSNTGHDPVPRHFQTGAANRQRRGIDPVPMKFDPIKHYRCTNPFSNCPTRALDRWDREQRHMPFECRRDCRECAWGVQRTGNDAAARRLREPRGYPDHLAAIRFPLSYPSPCAGQLRARHQKGGP